MVYEIDGKYYIMANHKFYEVEIKKDNKDNFDVQLIKNGKMMDFSKEKNYKQIPLEEAYKVKRNRNIID